jgi:hypothetical protein
MTIEGNGKGCSVVDKNVVCNGNKTEFKIHAATGGDKYQPDPGDYVALQDPQSQSFCRVHNDKLVCDQPNLFDGNDLIKPELRFKYFDAK